MRKLPIRLIYLANVVEWLFFELVKVFQSSAEFDLSFWSAVVKIYPFRNPQLGE